MRFRALFLTAFVLLTLTAVAQYSTSDNYTGLGRRASLTGTVRDQSNNGAGGVRVELQDAVTGRTVASTFTFTNGSFDFTNIPEGHYEVVAGSGNADSRGRVDLFENRDITLHVLTTSTAKATEDGTATSVSLSQMKVPGKARKLLQKAQDAFRGAHLDDAFNFVQKALGLYPEYAKALTLRGVLNLQRGDTKSAQPDLEKAVELDYADDMGFVALASLYNTEGNYDHALQVLERGITIHPNSWQAYCEMARAQIGRKDYDASLRILAKADTYLPSGVTFPRMYRAQALLGLKNVEGAITELRGYLEKDPQGTNAETARNILAKLGASEITEAKK